MDVITTSMMAELHYCLNHAWGEAKGQLTTGVMNSITAFPYYLIVGCEGQTNLEAVAVDRLGNFFAFTLGVGRDVGLSFAQGNLNMDVADFNDTLSTVAEAFAVESLERFREAA